MRTDGDAPHTLPPGPPPEGWYFLAPREALRDGSVLAVELAGEDLVLWESPAGPRLHTAWCPHLGAHLGQGGRVVGGQLRCPFHGFLFDADGTCTATGYGTRAPRGALLGRRLVIERDGLLLGWVGARAPTWEPQPTHDEGWSAFRLHGWSMRGHPQETSENSVDIGHFAHVHGYREVRAMSPLRTDGPLLEAHYHFRRPLPVGSIEEEIRIQVWGLGYSRVEVADQTFGARLRLLVLPTPRRGSRLRLTIGLAMLDPARAAGPWRWMPRWMAWRWIAPLLLRVYAREVEQDFRIWTTKRWLARPRLAEGDGPIGPYRAWARQFYPPAGLAAADGGRDGEGDLRAQPDEA